MRMTGCSVDGARGTGQPPFDRLKGIKGYPYNIPVYESLGVSRDTLLVALETPVYEIDQSPTNNLTLTEIMSAPAIRMLEPPYLYVMPTRSELVQMAIPSVASTS